MDIFLELLATLCITCLCGEPATTQLAGKVLFKGGIPKPKEIDIRADKKVVAFFNGKPAPVYPDLLVSKDGELADVVVFVSKGLNDQKFEAPKDPVIINIAGAMFEPHVVCAMVMQKIEIKDDGVTMHNPHYHSENELPKFSQGQRASEAPLIKQYSKPEFGIELVCDVHKWMSARICVFEHPFSAVSASDGSFEIKGLNPGKYTLSAWHETLGTKSMEIEVRKTDNAPIEFVFESKR